MTTTVAKAKDVKETKAVAVESTAKPFKSTPIVKAVVKEALAQLDVKDAPAVVEPGMKLVGNNGFITQVPDDTTDTKGKRPAKVTEIVAEVVVVEEAPTDRQIRNAERVLSAAGRDHETLVSEAIAKATAMVNGGGTLFIDGKLQTPLDVKIDMSHGHFVISPQESFYVPYHVSQTTKDKEFTFYRVGEIGTGTIYALDKDSSAELTSGHSTHYYHERSKSKNAMVVLINSHSKNDHFLGESSLVNMSSTGNVYNTTTLINDKKLGHFGLFRFDYQAEEKTEDQKIQRGTVKNCFFKRATIRNSTLSAGTYIEAGINDSFVESSGHCTVIRSELSSSGIRGARVNVTDSRLEKVNVNTEGRCTISHFRASGEYINSPSIHITNKFDCLKLETPIGHLTMVRSDRTTFDLGSSPYNTKRFEMNVEREELEKFVSSHISYSEEHTSSVFSESLVAHLVDSIVSRIGVIQMMSAAERLVQDVAPVYTRYEDVYSA